MKLYEDSLKVFRDAVAEACECDRPPEYYASMAVFYLKEATASIIKNARNPNRSNKRELTRGLYRTIKNLAQASASLGIDIPPPSCDNDDLAVLYSMFWNGESEPLLAYILFSLETNLFYSADWTMESLLRAAIKTVKKEEDNEGGAYGPS